MALAMAFAILNTGLAGAQVSDVRVYLVSHGWHVGLVLRRDDLTAVGHPEKYAPGSGQYLEVGWGDGDYYPAVRGTIALALRAAFRSQWSVLKVVSFDGGVTQTFPCSKILEVRLSQNGLAALARYIEGSYAVERDARPVIVAAAEYGSGFFYLARGHYRLFHNSNNWAARALKVAGCPIDVDGAVTAGAVLHQAARFASIVRPGVLLRASDEVPMRCK